jgi:hypothetical protein
MSTNSRIKSKSKNHPEESFNPAPPHSSAANPVKETPEPDYTSMEKAIKKIGTLLIFQDLKDFYNVY